MRCLTSLAAVLALGCSTTPLSTPDMIGDQAFFFAEPDMQADLTAAFASCSNGMQDGDETDVDCGGSCPACMAARMCKVASDCQSRVCTNRTCAAPTCNDGMKNAAESDVDCGGGACAPCPDGKTCGDGADCKSQVCVNLACKSSCTDGFKNGDETGTDCGGGTCPACADGKGCLKDSDCTSGICRTNVCQAKPRVLVVSGDPNGQINVQQLLLGTGAFSAVDTADAPTLQALQAHDVVLVWGTGTKIGGNVYTLSTNLATYFDGGGRVVLAMDASSGNYNNVGGFLDGKSGYIVMFAGVCCANPDKLGVVDEPNSPLMAGVHTFVGNTFGQDGAPAFGATAVAHYAGGRALIARGIVKGRNRVDLNFYPPSTYWQGDGAIILKNALLYE